MGVARPKLGKSETERLHVKISADEVNSIEDWRFANRIQSRSEAVRRLCQIGLLTSSTIVELERDAQGYLQKIFDRLPEVASAAQTSATEDTLSKVKQVADIVLDAMRDLGSLSERIAALADGVHGAGAITDAEQVSAYRSALDGHIRTVDDLLKPKSLPGQST
jgi:metal-responsive CopG/Arc/MetJ family transcriptional regulator